MLELRIVLIKWRFNNIRVYSLLCLLDIRVFDKQIIYFLLQSGVLYGFLNLP